MSNMKCPFCGQGLIPCVQNQNDWLYHCDNQKCPMYDDADIENAKHPLASEDLWQELIRTRKALDVAKEGLKSAKKRLELINNSKFANLNNVLQIQSQCEVLKIDEALEQITALEQKDK